MAAPTPDPLYCEDSHTRECDGCPSRFAPDELADGGNGGFYCEDCCARDGDRFHGIVTYEDHLIDLAWAERRARQAASPARIQPIPPVTARVDMAAVARLERLAAVPGEEAA